MLEDLSHRGGLIYLYTGLYFYVWMLYLQAWAGSRPGAWPGAWPGLAWRLAWLSAKPEPSSRPRLLLWLLLRVADGDARGGDDAVVVLQVDGAVEVGDGHELGGERLDAREERARGLEDGARAQQTVPGVAGPHELADRDLEADLAAPHT